MTITKYDKIKRCKFKWDEIAETVTSLDWSKYVGFEMPLKYSSRNLQFSDKVPFRQERKMPFALAFSKSKHTDLVEYTTWILILSFCWGVDILQFSHAHY